MSKQFDVIVIGAGSVGVPTALALAQEKLKVLVLDEKASPGQGQNKAAIGGIRATHSDPGKIKTCQRSLEIFSKWEQEHGDDIGWYKMGYSFPAYSFDDAQKLKSLVSKQKEWGLQIDWISKEDYLELVPGINSQDLQGSTYSPHDGSASPLLAINAFYQKSCSYGATYMFKQKVTSISKEENGIYQVKTPTDAYHAPWVINAAGSHAREIGSLLGLDLPVNPDSHEGGITEPVQPFFKAMVVDMRPSATSMNYYFYQNNEGQVVFCITPKPLIPGTDSDSTSCFLPTVAQRMINLYPRLKYLKVRRTWRGQYPMTPDGFPIVGEQEGFPGFINAVGMCGQGFMIGPGLGEVLTRLVTDNLNTDDQEVLDCFSPRRDFSGGEQFK